MEDQFLAFLDKEAPISPEKPVLAAVSGGIDSVVMLHLFVNQGFKVALAHVNFNLRGQDSSEDARFTKELAATYNIPFHLKDVDTKEYARNNDLSVQLAAREIRYNWFREILNSEGYSHVATAHHRDDNLETVIYNIINGGGLGAVHGIPAKRDAIIRPLLFASREEIQQYAKEKGLTWREDASNASDKYNRNYIRHHITPLLAKINPSVSETVLQFCHRIQDAEQLLNYSSSLLKEKFWIDKNDHIAIDQQVAKEVPGVATLLFDWLQPYGFNFHQIEQMVAAAGRLSGKQFVSRRAKIVSDRNAWILTSMTNIQSYEIKEQTGKIDTGAGLLHWNVERYEGQSLMVPENEAILCYDKVEMPLTLRPWQQGDWFIPFGMKGKKKLSDFMIDKKIPVNLKDRQLILTSGDSIIWLVGQRIDNRFAVESDTKHIIKLKWQKSDQPV